MHRHEAKRAELHAPEMRLTELYRAAWIEGWSWPALLAGCGLAGGSSAALIGALLAAGAWARGDATNGLSLHGISNALLLATIPLLLLGAHGLDLLERRTKTGREIIPAAARAPRPARV